MKIEKSTEFDICIVGAGIAGTVLAANLARCSYRILVIEKKFKNQERISGELLQPGGVQCLQEMGLGFLLQDIGAQEIRGYTLFLQDEYCSIPYDREKNLTACSFKNSYFVERARNYLRDLPNVELIEGNVIGFIEDDEMIRGVKYLSDRKQIEVRADLTFVCEGQISKLRKAVAQDNETMSGYFIGFILTDCDLPVPQHGHVILTGESPILIYPVSPSEKRILIDFPVRPEMNDHLQKYLKANIRPHLPPILHPAFDKAVANGSFKGMPNYNLKSYPDKQKKNVVLIGDCFNMRHPLTGGGMSAIFNDIKNIVTLFSQKPNLGSEPINKIISQFYKKRSKDVANINILADSLYQATTDPHLKQASFNYLKNSYNGEGTIRILAGLDKKKYNLIKHFTYVVVNGVNRLNLSQKKKIQLLGKAGKIILPLLLQEGNTGFHRWGNQFVNKLFTSAVKIPDEEKNSH